MSSTLPRTKQVEAQPRRRWLRIARPETATQPLKILFFSHYFPPEGNAPANRTYDNCVRWVREGHDVTVVTCAPNVPGGVVYDGYANRPRRQVEMVDGIRVVRVWTFLAPNAGQAKRIVNFVSYMLSAVWTSLWLRRPDVIVATSPQFFCGWAGVIASWLKWRPLVLEIRDIWPESIVTVGAMRRGPAIRVLEVLEKWMYRAATTVVTVGTGYRDKINAKVARRDPIAVIPNGVDLDEFAPQPSCDALRDAWGVGGRFVCGYIGTLGMAHGLEVVVSAAQRLKATGRDDVCFVLVGDGAERAELEELVRQADVADFVFFTGLMPHTRMPAALASIDVALVHLRDTELFATVVPSKIFEAMAMQRPIVMGVRGPARDIVLQAEAGVPLEPDNPAALADVLERLADDDAWRQSLAIKGREFVRAHFNRDDLAAEYSQLLQTVVAPQRAEVHAEFAEL